MVFQCMESLLWNVAMKEYAKFFFSKYPLNRALIRHGGEVLRVYS